MTGNQVPLELVRTERYKLHELKENDLGHLAKAMS